MKGQRTEAIRRRHGPIHERIECMVRKHSPDSSFTMAVLRESELGPGAFRIRRRDPAGRLTSPDTKLATWLSEQAGIERVGVYNDRIEVRVQMRALRSWPTEQEEVGALRKISCEVMRETRPAPDTSLECSLARVRGAVVGHALTEMLTAVGWDSVSVQPRDAELRVSRSLSMAPLETICVGVGDVDIKRDGICARHGGDVTAANLVMELGAVSTQAGFDEGYAGEPYAQAALRFLLNRVARTRRYYIDEHVVARRAEEFGRVLGAWDLAWTAGRRDTVTTCPQGATGVDMGERRIRMLAAHLDLTPSVVHTAADKMEPAALARFARALAEVIYDADGYLDNGDPLWRLAADSLGTSIAILAMPPQELQLNP
jgi:hypothetical protein